MSKMFREISVQKVAETIAYQMLYARQYDSFDRSHVNEINDDSGWTYNTPGSSDNWVRHENVRLNDLELNMAYALAHHIDSGMTVTSLIRQPAWRQYLQLIETMESLTEWNERMIAREMITCEACGRTVERFGEHGGEIALGMTDLQFCQPGYGCSEVDELGRERTPMTEE